eukprot:TRINITY_DN31790_c0_g1_i1.p1 TRINITY_DN31790_c0_g1~~TRINITY_DN31790_c0_g1_i1.p1  ORF type:complete len:293 (-),score=20.76 TRINITY_DN31790_c0_g1_i1:64-942(-)
MNLKKILFLFLFGYVFFIFSDYNDRVYASINDVKNEIKGVKSSLDLSDYKVDIEAKKIKSIKENLSGITYSDKTNTLFAITNSPRAIYELSKKGKVLRKIKLKGFKDTEGITYLFDNMFAFVDERKQKVFIFEIKKKTKKINSNDTKDSFALKINSYKNFGYEGIAYRKSDQTIFIINEKFPVQLIEISNFLNKKNLQINFDSRLSTFNHFMADFAGLHYHEKSQSLLFLSEESKSIAQVDSLGRQVSFLQLEKGFMNLKKDIPQAEGITVDNEDTLFIVSEPNLFYSFKRK